MIVYFDSSVLVKRYVTEEKVEEVDLLWSQSDEAACSVIGFAEVLSAIARRVREGAIAPSERDLLIPRFRSDWDSLVHVAVSEEVNEIAAPVLATYPLRAMDAIHLASAVSLRGEADREVLFASADARLAAAARSEGLRVFPE